MFVILKLPIACSKLLVILHWSFHFLSSFSSHSFVCCHVSQSNLLDLTFVLSLDKILLPLILDQEVKLSLIDGPPSLHSDQFHSVLRLHSQLNQRHGHQNRSPSQSGHTMNTDTHIRMFSKLLGKQIQPFLNNFRRRSRTIREGQFGDIDLDCLQTLGVVGGVGGANQVRNLVFLQDLDVILNGGILRLFGDQEPHVLVFDLGRSRSNDLARHAAGD